MALPRTPEQIAVANKALKDHLTKLTRRRAVEGDLHPIFPIPRSYAMESMAALEEKARDDIARVMGVDFGKPGGERVVVETVEKTDKYFFVTHRLSPEERERLKADGGKHGVITGWITEIDGVEIVEEFNLEDEKVKMRDAAGYHEHGGVWIEDEAVAGPEAEEPEKDERLVEVAPHVHANLRKVFGS